MKCVLFQVFNRFVYLEFSILFIISLNYLWKKMFSLEKRYYKISELMLKFLYKIYKNRILFNYF